MTTRRTPRKRAGPITRTLALLASLWVMTAAACGAPSSVNSTAVPAEQRPTGAPTIAPTSKVAEAAAPLKPLRLDPVSGFVGDTFHVSADGLPAGATVEWQWMTWDGAYETQSSGHDVLFMQRQYQEKRISLGRATADPTGHVEATLSAPPDYGEVHNLYAAIGGRDVARGGYRIVRRATLSPSEGPVGTPITVEITGLAWRPFESTMALRYDSAYTGFISAVTTGGAATFRVRAAGPVGQHVLFLTAASPGVPFLNNQQSGTSHIMNMDLRLPFTVTSDTGPPVASTEWPDASRLAAVARGGTTTVRVVGGVSAAVVPQSDVVGSTVTVQASGLPASTAVQVLWTRAGEDDPTMPPQLREQGVVVATSTTGPDGSLTVPLRVTDDRGGWHVIKLMVGGTPHAEVPFYVRRSIATIAPQRVRAGGEFAIELKGGGWTELDKGVAVTYDNSYIGYACSVTSGGDITINLVATGAPGTHLVDLYPMLYRHPGSHSAEYWNFELPQLTALDDHPGLARGYELPIFRLAIEVTE